MRATRVEARQVARAPRDSMVRLSSSSDRRRMGRSCRHIVKLAEYGGHISSRVAAARLGDRLERLA